MKNTIIFGLFLILLNQIGCSNSNQASNTNNTNESEDLIETVEDETLQDIQINPNLTPLETIKDLDKKVEAFKTGPKLSKEDIENNRKIKREIIRGVFDIRELSMRSLSSHWKKLSTKQQNQFVSLMTRLLERKAIFSKEQVKNTDKPYSIKYKSEKFLNDEKTNAKVFTQVRTSKYNLNIDYELIKNEKVGWKIYDVIVDDASLMKNYQFQFNAIIQKSGYEDLVSRMQTKLDQLQ
jgi:phospholipid transport system substrate-binding protein